MKKYTFRKSGFDPQFWEVLFGGKVVKEIRVLFQLKEKPPSFNSLEEVESWVQKQEYAMAKSYAYRLLSNRSYSKKMLQDKLVQKGTSGSVALKVLKEIESYGYISDLEFAKSLVRKKLQDGYGPSYIKQYLKSKGLDPSQVSFEEVSIEESIQKWKHKLKGKEKPKAIAFLLRKGFSYDLIQDFWAYLELES